MKLPRRLFRFSLALVSGLAVLMSCDNPSKPEPTAPEQDGAMTVSGVVEFSDALSLPDSGVWRTTKILSLDSGRGTINCSLKDGGKYDCSQSFDLGGVLGSDSLIQDMYAMGLHIERVTYTQTGAALVLKTDSASTVRSVPEWSLLRAFLADFQKTHTASQKATRADLAAYYAKLLLVGDTTYVGAPLPQGLVLDSVKKAVVLLASQQALTAKVLADKNLVGLTTETIHELVGVLVKAGVSIDTTVLYPAAPVRVTQEIKVASDLTIGGASVGVTGSFAWNAKLPLRKFEARVMSSKGTESAVEIGFKKSIDSASGSFVLTDNMTLKAKAGAQVGTDTLIVTAMGDSGSQTSRAVFRVVSRDTSSIDLSIVSPSRDTTVPYSTEKILVVAQVSGTSGIAEVVIGGTRLTKSPYLATIDLATGFNLIVVQAKDSAGNVSIDSVLVSRQKTAGPVDTIAPVILLKSPRSDTTVASGLDSLKLEWIVTDNSDSLAVTLNDSAVSGDSSIYRKSVALRTGSNAFTIKARDAQGNLATRVVTVTRAIDPIHPSILGPADQTVDPLDSTFKLDWKITNVAQVAKISFDSKDVPVDSEIVREVDLKVGANAFTLVVIDPAGKIYTQTVIITRPAQATLPSIAALSDRTVGSDLDTATLIWTITNSAKAKSGTVNGEVVVVGPTISKTVNLQSGPNRVTLELKDASGATVSSSVTITRAIDTALLGVSHPSDRSVSPEIDTATLAWTVYNSGKALSATLNDKVMTLGATISQVVKLSVGSNSFVLTLKDAKGNTVSDTVIVSRAADTKGPVIAWIDPTTNKSVDATVTSYAVQLKVTDASGVDSVFLNGSLLKKQDGDLYAATVALPKPDGNPVMVVVLAKDANGNITRDSLSVTRKVPDNTDKPVIRLLKPGSATGNALPFETTMLHVEADISDALLAIDARSVKFNDVLATATGSVYAADVPVLLTGKTVTITIKAANINGTTSTMDIEVTRSKDGLKPVITADSSTKTQTVEYRTKTITLTWKVTDNVGVAGLTYNGQFKQVAATVTQPLNLAVGDNKAVLVATDSAGNKDSSVVVITRKADPTAPVVVLTSPSKDTTVAYGTASLSISATATDPESGIKSLTINGQNAKTTGKATVTLAAGKNPITLVATDSADLTTTLTLNVTVQGIVATPGFNPAGGTFTTMQSVAITSATQDASIYYTTDGTTPTASSTKYTASITIDASKTIKAIAVSSGTANSPVATATYTINYPLAPAPTFTKAAGTYTSAQSVTITTPTKNAKIYYTTSGKDPTPDSTEYKTPITVDKSMTIKALVVAPGFANSPSSAVYVINYPAATPTFTPDASAPLTGAQWVTISSTTANATICYTIGKNPAAPSATTTGSTTCSPSGVKINVSFDTTIRAIAVAANFSKSAEAAASFIFNYDASLGSITVDGVKKPVAGTKIDWEVSGLKGTVDVSAMATDKTNAKVTVDGGVATAKSISLTADVTVVKIVVTNGTADPITYTLNLTKADTGSVPDANKQVYKAVKFGTRWWLTENMNWGGGESTVVGSCEAPCKDGRKYTWAEASGTVCPAEWRLPTKQEWTDLTTEQAGLLAVSTVAGSFWTSTTDMDVGANAWVGVIATGKVATANSVIKTETEWVRCVK